MIEKALPNVTSTTEIHLAGQSYKDSASYKSVFIPVSRIAGQFDIFSKSKSGDKLVKEERFTDTLDLDRITARAELMGAKNALNLKKYKAALSYLKNIKNALIESTHERPVHSVHKPLDKHMKISRNDAGETAKYFK